MTTYVNSYRIDMTMEGNETIIWEGYADDENHAEGLAIEYATGRTKKQVLGIEEIEEFDQFEVISEHEAENRYDEMIDDCHEEVEVCFYTYSPSYVLKSVDPIAYRCGFSDFCSDLESEHHTLVEGFY